MYTSLPGATYSQVDVHCEHLLTFHALAENSTQIFAQHVLQGRNQQQEQHEELPARCSDLTWTTCRKIRQR